LHYEETIRYRHLVFLLFGVLQVKEGLSANISPFVPKVKKAPDHLGVRTSCTNWIDGYNDVSPGPIPAAALAKVSHESA
jgi:hypothetical protein